MYFKGRGDKEGSRSGEASGQLRSAPGPMELVRISPPPRQLQGDSRNIPELLPDRSEKAPGQLPEILQKGTPAAPKRLPKSCRPASQAIRQNSWAILGQPRFPLFCNTFSIFLIFSITVSARISQKAPDLPDSFSGTASRFLAATAPI